MSAGAALAAPDGVYITVAPPVLHGPGSGKRCPQCGGRGRHLCVPRAERAVQVFEQCLVHTKGVYARAPFILAQWQRDIIIPVFGWVEWSDQWRQFVRVFRLLWLEVARKNGKSELCAGIALILLCADGEEGAEVYGAAKDIPQARKVFDVAARMVELSAPLRKRLRVYKQSKRIVFERTGSFYEAVPADAAGNLGHNVHGAVVDEVLTQPNGDLWDALKQGMGTRVQPLMVGATTAGNDPVGFASQEHAISVRVAADATLDPRRFVYIRGMPRDADWRDEKNWPLANPALGDFLSLDTLRDEAREAALSLRKQNAFRQFRGNQWVQQVSRWIDLHQWDAGGGILHEEDLYGRTCNAGLDLSHTTDLTALAYLFTPEDKETGVYQLVLRHFIPEARRKSLAERTSGQSEEWERAGYLTVTDGDVLDYAAIRVALRRDTAPGRWQVRELGYDPYNATEFVEQRLGGEDGFHVVPVRQGYLTLSPPSKELERLIIAERIQHGGNPVLRWMIDNVVARTDPAGNIKPDKTRSGDAIDGVVATINALERAMRQPPRRRSAYETRGLTVA